jgi:L-iditol 2-dehydrogenase
MLNNGFALYGKEDLRAYSWELPELEPGGVILRIKACGICGSDLRYYFGGPSPRYTLPAVLGHEMVGKVERVGAKVEGVEVGDLVAVAPVIPCMRCPACLRGEDNLCEKSQVIGVNVPGGMAERFYVPPAMVTAGGLVKVPRDVDPGAAALTELVSTCWHGLRQVRFHVGSDVLLIGPGPIGMTFIQILRLMGAGRIVVAGLSAERLAVAGELGADRLLDVSETSLEEHLRSVDFVPDLVIVAAPTVDDAVTALEHLRPGGQVLLFSGYPYGSHMSIDLYKFHYAEKHIHSSIDATIQDFNQAMRLQARLQMARLVTHRVPLAATAEAFAEGRDLRRIKVLVEP